MTAKRPQLWDTAAAGELQTISAVCLDIDDTLSTRGKLTSEAYSALWFLKWAGFVVIPITGRPAGWCDHIARFWPVDAVVGENGAFTFYMENGVRRRIETPGAAPDRLERMEKLRKKIIARFPQVKWASDQAYREHDLAIDVCEDVPEWPRADVEELLRICQDEGAHAKLSSVHVNAWFGQFDKQKGLDHWVASGLPGIARDKAATLKKDDFLFIGDSPNDEPMFKTFKFSVGVANLKVYLDRLKYPPRWITHADCGAGFHEMVRRLVANKKP